MTTETVQIGDFNRNSKEALKKIDKAPVELRKGSTKVAMIVSFSDWNAVNGKVSTLNEKVSSLNDKVSTLESEIIRMLKEALDQK